MANFKIFNRFLPSFIVFLLANLTIVRQITASILASIVTKREKASEGQEIGVLGGVNY